MVKGSMFETYNFYDYLIIQDELCKELNASHSIKLEITKRCCEILI
jgi:hypothetical protein